MAHWFQIEIVVVRSTGNVWKQFPFVRMAMTVKDPPCFSPAPWLRMAMTAGENFKNGIAAEDQHAFANPKQCVIACVIAILKPESMNLPKSLVVSNSTTFKFNSAAIILSETVFPHPLGPVKIKIDALLIDFSSNSCNSISFVCAQPDFPSISVRIYPLAIDSASTSLLFDC